MKRKFTTTLDEDVIKQIRILAIERNESVACIIARWLKSEIKNNAQQSHNKTL
ncbi:DUF6364 family protein [Oenococcus oeni]|uniref:DUF6364 family protein n=1 Tax=Oenococcus oeni TaxID=1247 RepID=UPI001EF9DEF0|nr:DUF6364 family protein [Oenococcus oeni]